MAIRERRIRGVARAGKIEFEPTVVIADGTVVDVVLVQESVSGNAEETKNRLLANLSEGIYLGGGPYMNRDEFYGDTGRPK